MTVDDVRDIAHLAEVLELHWSAGGGRLSDNAIAERAALGNPRSVTGLRSGGAVPLLRTLLALGRAQGLRLTFVRERREEFMGAGSVAEVAERHEELHPRWRALVDAERALGERARELSERQSDVAAREAALRRAEEEFNVRLRAFGERARLEPRLMTPELRQLLDRLGRPGR